MQASAAMATVVVDDDKILPLGRSCGDDHDDDDGGLDGDDRSSSPVDVDDDDVGPDDHDGGRRTPRPFAPNDRDDNNGECEEEEGTATWRGENPGMMQTMTALSSPSCSRRPVGPPLSSTSTSSSSSSMTSSTSTRMTTVDPLASAEGAAAAAAVVATAVVFAYRAS